MPGDVFMIPFSLMWGGFAFFWEATVLHQSVPGFFALWGIPFVAMGLYLIVGRFFVDAYRRSRTWYGLTDQRVLIIGGVFGRDVKSLDLATLAALKLAERSDRSGTITFGPYAGNVPEWMGSNWPGAGGQMPPRFEMLEDARSIYERVREAQKQARETPR